mgnify:CR=1 FL=1
MIKLVASDLDGTLLFKGAQSLPEEIFPTDQTVKKKWEYCLWLQVDVSMQI